MSSLIVSRMLAFLRNLAARASGVALSSPNIRSKSTRGLTSTLKGCVGVRQDTVFMYPQTGLPMPQVPMRFD